MITLYKLDGFNEKEALFIDKVLRDSRGWRGLGHDFRISLSERPDFDVIIMKRSNIEVKKEFPRDDLDGLSVARTWSKPMQIWVNSKNWNDVPDGVDMDLTAYRAYIIQHEMGHILGYDHDGAPQYPHQKCPVMYQQTRGTKGVCRGNPWLNVP